MNVIEKVIEKIFEILLDGDLIMILVDLNGEQIAILINNMDDLVPIVIEISIIKKYAYVNDYIIKKWKLTQIKIENIFFWCLYYFF